MRWPYVGRAKARPVMFPMGSVPSVFDPVWGSEFWYNIAK